MGSIYDISKLNSEINKSNNKKLKSKTDTSSINNNSKLSENSGSIKDRAEISDESIQLFKLQKESKKYIDMIKNVHLVSEKQLQELKENVLSDFYSENDVVEAIAEKVLSMSNFKN